MKTAKKTGLFEISPLQAPKSKLGAVACQETAFLTNDDAPLCPYFEIGTTAAEKQAIRKSLQGFSQRQLAKAQLRHQLAVMVADKGIQDAVFAGWQHLHEALDS